MADDIDVAGEIAPAVGLRPAIEGSAAAAILLMLLDESDAATILKHLDPDEVRQLAKGMFDAANANEGQIEHALDIEGSVRIMPAGGAVNVAETCGLGTES